MNLDGFWGLGFGTGLFFFVILGVFFFKRLVRNRYFPPDEGPDRSEAMAELLAFQARLQQRADQDSSRDQPPETEGKDSGA